MKRVLSCSVLFALVMACGDSLPRTQVMLVIDAEAGVRAQTHEVQIVIRGGTGAMADWQERLDRTFVPGDNAEWPMELALVPVGDDASRVYEATATAVSTTGDPVARVRAVSGYRKGKTLVLRLLFEDDCRDQVEVCNTTQTCKAGACVDANVDATSLETFKPGVGVDAGIDAGGSGGSDGSVDAGIDTGVDAADINECLSTNVCTVDYPCQNLASGYTCRGQFPDWPPAYSSTAFTVNGDATVTDSRSGLMWQRDVGSTTYSWLDAKNYCASLSLAGMDWRLPTKSELESLIDDSHYPTVPDSAAFPSAQNQYLWSSSPSAGSVNHAHAVHFSVGKSNAFSDISNTYAARCVRSDAVVVVATGTGGAPPGRYTLAANGTVYDTRTLLTWQQSVDAGLYTWAEAQAFCAELSLSGVGWRLPSRNELLALVDPTSSNPAIDLAAFPNAPTLLFWSSSPVQPNASSGWAVDFTNGGTEEGAPASDPHAVRCVR